MIDLQNLLSNPETYKLELERRYKNPNLVEEILEVYGTWKTNQSQLDGLRQQKNEFNKLIVNLSKEEKPAKIAEMKIVSDQISDLEKITKEFREKLDGLVTKIPNVMKETVPLGVDDGQNPVIEVFGNKPIFGFTPKPYWELPVYKKYVSQEDGVKAMGSRGFYLTGEIARFQKVLFDWALDQILAKGFELFYVPLMLNEKVLTGTGHLPDFDGQQYEVQIDENKSFYLIGSSEPSVMGYFMDKNLGKLDKPVLVTCQSSCFRKEAGSYGKDQQGILRVHQFEKVEMVVICKPEEIDTYYQKNREINISLLSKLGLCFHLEQICTGDMPHKHHNQEDFCAYFPSQDRFREVGSNGNASDYQNRGLNISYTDENGEKQVPFGLNDTGLTFRTGLAILEQFQTEDGRVKIPEVLVARFGKEYLE